MVEHGARNIVLLSRSGGNVGELRQLIDDTQDKASIVVKTCDIASEDDVYQIVKECTETLPPICGVIHAAMMLHVSFVLFDGEFPVEPTLRKGYLIVVLGRVDRRHDPRLVRVGDSCQS